MRTIPNTIHITLPRHICAGGLLCNVLSYDAKRREASLSNGQFIGLTWPMDPEQWDRERANWIARGAAEGAEVFYNPQYGISGLIGEWGWILTA